MSCDGSSAKMKSRKLFALQLEVGSELGFNTAGDAAIAVAQHVKKMKTAPPPELVVKEEEGAVSTHDEVPAIHAYATRGGSSAGP